MKFKKEFMIREIVGETILIPVGESNNHFNGIITINEYITFDILFILLYILLLTILPSSL